jgi:hypothetical protein
VRLGPRDDVGDVRIDAVGAIAPGGLPILGILPPGRRLLPFLL